MPDLTYARVTELDEAEKPWRSVWRTPTGFFVKVHARRREGELGRLTWELTGSQCDAEGKAIRRDDGAVAILGGEAKPFRHLFKVAADAAPEDVEPIADRLRRETLFVVARVERAAINERDAAAL